MNYNGNRSLKEGSEGVKGKNFENLNLSDQAGEDKPWMSSMTEDRDNSREENFYTFWEFTSRKFQDQNCTLKRKIGDDDIGKIKIKSGVSYNVYIGAKIYYSKGASTLSRAADAAEPLTMKVNYAVAQEQK